MDLTSSKTSGSKPEYHMAFGQFSSARSQLCNTLKPIEIEIDTQEDVAGGIHTMDFDKGDIIVKQSGMYMIIAAPQVGKVRGSKPRWLDFWLRVNNVDVPNSTIRRVLSDSHEKDVIPLNAVLPLNRGDSLNLIMAAESEDEGIGIECIEPDGAPVIPSVIITLVQLA